jgi:hypothetical protein
MRIDPMRSEPQTTDDTEDCRFFATYIGIKLPLKLVWPIAATALANRHTYMPAHFDAAGRTRFNCSPMLVGCGSNMRHRLRSRRGSWMPT